MASRVRHLLRPLFNRIESAGFWCVRRILYSRGQDVTEALPGQRVLVVAPHQDDETLGAGVTVMRLVEGGKTVHIAVVTDGRNSHKSSRISREELAALRRQEMINACQKLGVSHERVHFGPCEDRFVGDQMEKAERFLRDLVEEIQPDLVISPSGIDRHYDHQSIARIITKLAVERHIMGPVYEYPIWFFNLRSWVNLDRVTPRMFLDAIWRPAQAAFSLPVVLVRTDGYLDRKRAALDAHRSQMVNLTNEPSWLVLPQDWLRNFFTPYEMFFPLQVSKAPAPQSKPEAAHA